MRITSCGLLAILPLLVAPAVAGQPAAGSLDSRWTAWFGCWQQLEETVRQENLVEPGARDTVPTKGVVVCVRPAANPAAARFSTIVETQAALDETIVADGSPRTIDEPGCHGSQRARWSENGRRLFARTELTCDDGTKREISGLTTMAPGSVWVDIQVVRADGRENIRVRRYRRAPDESAAGLPREQLATAAQAAARQAAPFTLDEVKEGVGQVSPSTIEAALVETNAAFPLNARRLQELDAAGVPDRLLDLMIALSFPNRFVVERRSSGGGAGLPGGFGDWGWFDPEYAAFPYHYAPFAYGLRGRYDTHYYGAPVLVELEPVPQRSGDGRVVDGLGYTRVRSRESQPVSGSGVGDMSGGISSSGGSSSGSGVSSQGYSGGGGSDSGRTAVARPPR